MERSKVNVIIEIVIPFCFTSIAIIVKRDVIAMHVKDCSPHILSKSGTKLLGIFPNSQKIEAPIKKTTKLINIIAKQMNIENINLDKYIFSRLKPLDAIFFIVPDLKSAVQNIEMERETPSGCALSGAPAPAPRGSTPSQALPRQIPPFVTCGDIFPRSGGSLSSKGEPSH